MAADYPYIAIKPKGVPQPNDILYPSEQQRKIDKKIQSMRHHVGLYRMCRLFLNVSFEGVRIDNVAIVDEINFDCYESIMEGVQSALANLQDRAMPPEGVHIEGLWYYKKRARGRMTAVPLVETTDGFRAIAEHPSGEVYIGVRFTQIMTAIPILERRQMLSEHKRKLKRPRQTNPPVDSGGISKEEKDSKLDDDPVSEAAEKVGNKKSKVEQSDQKQQDPKNQTFLNSHEESLGPEEGEEEKKPKFFKGTIWPLDSTVEITVKSPGVEEKTTLHPDFYSLLYHMIHTDNARIAEELLEHSEIFNHVSKMSRLTKRGVLKPQNQTPNVKDACTDTNSLITKDLKCGKEEVFRLMSQMALSKVDFKKLLSWTKSLRLLPGKSGKYFLTERNILGRTKVEDTQPAIFSDRLVTPSSSVLVYRDAVSEKPQKMGGPFPLIPVETLDGDKKKTLYLPASGPPVANQQGALFVPIPSNYLPLIQQQKANMLDFSKTNMGLGNSVEENANLQTALPLSITRETDSPMVDRAVPTGVFKVSQSDDPYLKHLQTAGYSAESTRLKLSDQLSDSEYYPSEADMNDTDTSNPSEYVDTTDFEGSLNSSELVSGSRKKRKTSNSISHTNLEDYQSDDLKSVDEQYETNTVTKDKNDTKVESKNTSKGKLSKSDKKVRQKNLDDVLRIKYVKQENAEKQKEESASTLSKQVLRIRRRKKDKPVRKNSPAPKDILENETSQGSEKDPKLVVVKTEPADDYE
ncbi:hypothetical protein ScPMuIL_011899 [Solemya velum]